MIGAIARLLLPGRQEMSIVATIILGVIAAVVGRLAWEAIFPDNDGVAWIGSIIVAVVLLYLYVMFAGRRPNALDAVGATLLPLREQLRVGEQLRALREGKQTCAR